MKTINNSESDKLNCRNRYVIYNFFSQIYLNEPTTDFITLLKKNSALFEEIKSGFISIINKDNDELLEKFNVEYTKLFIGPGKHIHPYGSVYLDSGERLWGVSTSYVKSFIEGLGFNYNVDWKGLPDHFGVELELLSKLIDVENTFRKENNGEKIKQCLLIEKKFLNNCIGKWYEPFCDKVISQSSVSLFYKYCAEITKDFLTYDIEFVNKF